MKKLKLDLNDLKIESFTVNSESATQNGTIRGQGYDTEYIGCEETIPYTCDDPHCNPTPACPTASPMDSCGCITQLQVTCNYVTCGVSCHCTATV